MPNWMRWARGVLPLRPTTATLPYLLIEEAGIAYCRIPKAANSTVRRLLAASLGLRGPQTPAVNTDTFWHGEAARAAGARMVGAREIAERRRDGGLLVFTVVREPFERLKSCFEAKILDTTDGTRRRDLDRRFPAGLSFADFVARAAGTPDAQADVHIEAQAHILAVADAGLPDRVLRLERIAADWEALRPALAARGVTVRDWPQRRHRADVTRLDNTVWTPPLIALAAARYADDFRLFYPEVTRPAGPPAPDG
ncbi:MAG: hypothetical protein AcusKO_19210 [Acuticoccus sp.]